MKKTSSLLLKIISFGGMLTVQSFCSGPASGEALTQKLALEVKEAQEVARKISPQIPTSHPRLLFPKADLERFRAFYQGMKKEGVYPEIVNQAIEELSGKAPEGEPQKPNPGPMNAVSAKQWEKAFQLAFKCGATAQRYAFSYLLTDDPKYAKEAAKWLLHIAAWDIKGGIDYDINDEAFIQHLSPMIFAYDWAYHGLSNEERAIIEKAIKVRMEILYPKIVRYFSILEKTPLDSAESHAMRFISTLGIGGVALHGHSDSAATHVAWAYAYYSRYFPVWGGDDGGYSEGLNYWDRGQSQHARFIDVMAALGFKEMVQRPYYRNNGYFAFYQAPFVCANFGDKAQIFRPDETTILNLEKYALLFEDPYLMKYQQLNFISYPQSVQYYTYSLFDSFYQLFGRSGKKIKTKEFSELPRSRVFRDVGWVAFHTRLGNPFEDVMLNFKCSPFGAKSHSFADQNSFVMTAYGAPLAISSGYREWYGSPHHFKWTKQTVSKNAILFDGQGQDVKKMGDDIGITRFVTTSRFDSATGDATAAYGDDLGILKSLRHIVHVACQYFLIVDELKSSKAMNHQWLLHAKTQMNVYPKSGEAVIFNQNSEMRLKLVTPDPQMLSWAQTSAFQTPVDPAHTSKPGFREEWHLTVGTKEPQESRVFAALIGGSKGGQNLLPTITSLECREGHAWKAKKGGVEDLICFGGDEKKSVIQGSTVLQGLWGVTRRNKGPLESVFVTEARQFSQDNFEFSSDKPLSMEIAYQPARVLIDYRAPEDRSGKPNLEKRTVKFWMPFQPQHYEGIKSSEVKWDSAKSMVSVTLSGSGRIEFGKTEKTVAPVLASVVIQGVPLESFNPQTKEYLILTDAMAEKLPELQVTCADPEVKVTQIPAKKQEEQSLIRLESPRLEGEVVEYTFTWVPDQRSKILVKNEMFSEGVQVSASDHDGNKPQNAIDGNLSTRWAAEGQAQWLLFDLGKTKSISKAMISFFQGKGRETRFNLESSLDGKTWAPIFSGQSSGQSENLEEFSFQTVESRYVRLNGKGNTMNDWNTISEVIFR